jgi:hypothetical protein
MVPSARRTYYSYQDPHVTIVEVVAVCSTKERLTKHSLDHSAATRYNISRNSSICTTNASGKKCSELYKYITLPVVIHEYMSAMAFSSFKVCHRPVASAAVINITSIYIGYRSCSRVLCLVLRVWQQRKTPRAKTAATTTSRNPLTACQDKHDTGFFLCHVRLSCRGTNLPQLVHLMPFSKTPAAIVNEQYVQHNQNESYTPTAVVVVAVATTWSTQVHKVIFHAFHTRVVCGSWHYQWQSSYSSSSINSSNITATTSSWLSQSS